jgi:hypothetical protein
MFLNVRDDLLAVEATVFDEDLVGMPAGNNHAGKVDAWNITLAGFGVAVGAGGSGIDFHTHPAQEIKVGMVAGQSKDKLIFNAHPLTLRIFNPHRIRRNLFDGGFHACPD